MLHRTPCLIAALLVLSTFTARAQKDDDKEGFNGLRGGLYSSTLDGDWGDAEARAGFYAGYYRNLIKYDPIKSFAPITMLASNPNVLLAHPSVPATTARDIIAISKKSPGKLTMGSAGTGSITHLAGELFTHMAGITVTHVPYKGGGPNVSALLGGQIQITVTSVPAALGHVKAGKIKALGVTGAKRSPVMPEVPTIAESAVPGYEAKNWYAMLAPAGVPRPILAKLNQQVNEALRARDIADAIAKQGADPEGGTAEAFGAYLKSEIEKWSKVIAAAGLKVE